MALFYDKRFVYFEWDDRLVGKTVVYGDTINDLKSNLKHNITVQINRKSDNDSFPFSIRYDDGEHSCFRFVYYDPLIEYKIAYDAGKRVEYNAGDDWHPVYDGFYWNDEYRYRIVKNEDSAVEELKRLTNQQLSKWLAQGNGQYKYRDDTLAISSFVCREHIQNEPVEDIILVRKWEDTEWHEPTVEYCCEVF